MASRTRRTFLKTSAAAGAGLLLSPGLRARSTAANDKLNSETDWKSWWLSARANSPMLRPNWFVMSDSQCWARSPPQSATSFAIRWVL